MAETGQKAANKAAVEPANDPSPQPASPAPKREEVRESADGYVRVRTTFPHSTFSVEGVPTIDAEGVVLTKEQVEKVQELAPTYGVTLNIEEVK